MIANSFNDFFTKIGPSLASKIPPPDTTVLEYILSSDSPPDSLFFTPCTSEELLKISRISSNLLKHIIPEIIDVLIHIFNCSLSTGIVPSKLKIAKVNPVLKSGDKNKFINYRPSSILPSISKLLENVVYNRIYDFVTNHKIFTPNQFGFRKKQSTFMAINNLYDIITNAIDRTLHTVGISLNLSKAFARLTIPPFFKNLIIAVSEEFQTTGSRTIWKVDTNLLFMTKPVQSQIRSIVEFPKARSWCLTVLVVHQWPAKMFKFPRLHSLCWRHKYNLFKWLSRYPWENKDLHIISNWFKLNKLSLM